MYAIDPQKKIFRLIEIYQPNAKVIPLSSIFPTVSKSDVGYCKNYYLKLQEESRTFENFTNSSKGFQNDVFNLAMGFQLSHLWSKLDISTNISTLPVMVNCITEHTWSSLLYYRVEPS